MKKLHYRCWSWRLAIFMTGTLLSLNAGAVLLVQCPGDDGSNGGIEGDAIVDSTSPAYSNVACVHLTASDGYMKLGDNRDSYFFSFNNITGTTAAGAPAAGQLRSKLPAPTIVAKEGQELYLTLSNVGMIMRPDLPDAHTVHYHGFPEASAIFDGVPDVSLSSATLASMTYYYNLVEPGTYFYHCHFEASEHMQMGMIGNLWVEPAQNELPDGSSLGAFTHRTGNKYAYNDGDGSTNYDVEFPLQIIGFDGEFHDASENITALPFAYMEDKYPMINGRGYPDTVISASISNLNGYAAQTMNSIVEATAGQKILLRVSNVSIVNSYSLRAPGLTLKLLGRGARLLRGPSGKDLYRELSQVTLAGGDAFDILIDTQGVAPGVYFLHTTNLNYLSNDQEDNGGIMTEIRIN